MMENMKRRLRKMAECYSVHIYNADINDMWKKTNNHVHDCHLLNSRMPPFHDLKSSCWSQVEHYQIKYICRAPTTPPIILIELFDAGLCFNMTEPHLVSFIRT